MTVKIVNFGFSSGVVLEILKEKGLIDGHDLVNFGSEIKILDITEPRDLFEYDLSLCIDVLQQISESAVLQVIRNISHTARQVICIQDDSSISEDDVRNVKSPTTSRPLKSWWEPLFNRYLFIDYRIEIEQRKVLYICRRRDEIFLEDEFEGFKNKRVAVVGNGPILEGKTEEIDAHDVVIRMNNYRLNNLSGNKVTHWLVHGHTFIEKRPAHDVCYCPKYLKHSFMNNHPRPGFYEVPMITTKRNWGKELQEGILQNRFEPSTGLGCLYIMNSLGVRANAYGFNGLREGHYWNSSHKHYGCHNGDLEMSLYNTFSSIVFAG